MTREEAREYLGFSVDDKIDIDKLEAAYNAKLSISQDSREKLEEAVNILLEIYDTENNKPDSAITEEKHENLFMKLAVLMAGVFVLCFAGVVFFVYKIHSDNVNSKPQSEAVSSIEYEKILRELEEIRIKQEETPPPPADYADIIEPVMTAMVFIETDKGTGSGFLVNEKDDILTNYHVIKDAEYITVTPYDCQPVEALLKDIDVDKDLALLKASAIRTKNLARQMVKPSLKISSNLPRTGDSVIAIGSPRGLSGSASNGIVSAVREDKKNTLWVQFTAPVSPGSSGGALINLQGEVVGMPTWEITEAQNLNFAVASKTINQFLNSAINKPAKPLPKKSNTVILPLSKQPKAPKKSNSSGIPLPDAKGFLVHKWGCTVESIRRYVANPLYSMGTEGFYSTYKSFKAFKSKIDVVVVYRFDNNKLGSIIFIITDKRKMTSLQSIIAKELTELYKTDPVKYYRDKDKSSVYAWYNPKLGVLMFYSKEEDFLRLQFIPFF